MNSLKMIKSDLSDVPDAALPEGFALRTLNTTDENEKGQWKTLITSAFGYCNEFKEIESRDGYAPDSIWLIVDTQNNAIAATGVIYFEKEMSYLDDIAASLAYAGKRLGYEITAALLRCARDKGYTRIVLHTQDYRPAAVKIYLALGFVPDLTSDETAPVRWEKLYKILASPSKISRKCNHKPIHWPDLSIEELKAHAERGEFLAAFELANKSYYGADEVRNHVTAAHWYAQLAEQGHSQSQKMLAQYYRNGQGVEKNEMTALLWYTKAAEQDNREAQYQLGLC